MIKLFATLFTLALLAPTAKAVSFPQLQDTKELVRLSLWYEGTDSFDQSLFRPGAAFEWMENESQVADNTAIISEELATALENWNI